MPTVHNTRSAAQWEIISRHVDFAGKSVLDLGCGYGDILFRTRQAGAVNCLGIEGDAGVYNATRKRASLLSGVKIFHTSIESFCAIYDTGRCDIVICFAVLPYLTHPADTLLWIQAHADTALIECQYAGDGPGFDFLADDRDMEAWLKLCLWPRVEAIGRTRVEGRGVNRTIWLCEQGK